MSKFRVRLKDYSDWWPQMFQAERLSIAGILGPLAVDVIHVGSTSIPGLMSKGTIDMLVLVKHMDDAPRCTEELIRIGYQYAPEHERQISSRRLLFKEFAGIRTHQIHLFAHDDVLTSRYLKFRDRLREDPQKRHEYQKLKLKLADECGDNIARYTGEKSPFVRSVLEESP